MSIDVPFYLDLSILVVILAPVVALVALVRSRLRSGRRGLPTTMWASAGLVLVRTVLLLLVSWSVVWALESGDTSQSIDDRVTLERGWFDDESRHHDDTRMVLRVVDKQELQLCPTRLEPVGDDGSEREVERRCWLRRKLDKYDDGVVVSSWTREKVVEAPPARVERTMSLVWLLSIGCYGLMLFALERILRQVARGKPFAPANVAWLRVFAGGLAVLTIVIPRVVDRFVDGLIREFMPASARVNESVGPDLTLGGIFAVLLVLVLAEVWRFGIRLQDDAEATV